MPEERFVVDDVEQLDERAVLAEVQLERKRSLGPELLGCAQERIRQRRGPEREEHGETGAATHAAGLPATVHNGPAHRTTPVSTAPAAPPPKPPSAAVRAIPSRRALQGRHPVNDSSRLTSTA